MKSFSLAKTIFSHDTCQSPFVFLATHIKFELYGHTNILMKMC